MTPPEPGRSTSQDVTLAKGASMQVTREVRLEADLRYARGLLRLLREAAQSVPFHPVPRTAAQQAAVEAFTTACTAVDESGLAEPVGSDALEAQGQKDAPASTGNGER
jgi:hypothetical protein